MYSPIPQLKLYDVTVTYPTVDKHQKPTGKLVRARRLILAINSHESISLLFKILQKTEKNYSNDWSKVSKDTMDSWEFFNDSTPVSK